eukprot:scaffold1136_cov260-Pinguiococcus_pyrenoidosus.AAC.26
MERRTGGVALFFDLSPHHISRALRHLRFWFSKRPPHTQKSPHFPFQAQQNPNQSKRETRKRGNFPAEKVDLFVRPSHLVVSRQNFSNPSRTETSLEMADPAAASFERDTDAAEDVVDLFALLLPSAELRRDVRRFSLSYNMAALDGWVKQPSPCCAAAAVAGAWNALHGLRRRDPSAESHASLLEIYVDIVQAQLRRKRQSFERLLGAEMGALLEALDDCFGEKSRKVSKKATLREVKRLTKQAVAELGDAAPPVYLRLFELYEAERTDQQTSASTSDSDAEATEEKSLEKKGELRKESEKEADERLMDFSDHGGRRRRPRKAKTKLQKRLESRRNKASRADSNGGAEADEEIAGAAGTAGAAVDKDDDHDDDDDRNDEDNDDADEEEGEVDGEAEAEAEGPEKGKADNQEKEREKESKPWNWRSDLLEVLRKASGIRKLSDPRKPSTGPIGNWGIISAVKELNDRRQEDGRVQLVAELLMGRSRLRKPTKVRVGVRPGMTSEELDVAWASLRTAFLLQDSVVVFHLKNHYALLYALREWEEDCPIAASAESRENSKQASEASAELNEGTEQQMSDMPDQEPFPEPKPEPKAEPSPDARDKRRTVRQMLTARRGQRPSAWIDFEEAVETMCRCDGYKMIHIHGKRTLKER